MFKTTPSWTKQLGDMSMAAFIEEVDILVGKNHLLKRGLLLVKVHTLHDWT